MCQTTIYERINEVQILLAEAKKSQGSDIVKNIASAEVILNKIVNEGQVPRDESKNEEEEKEEEKEEESSEE